MVRFSKKTAMVISFGIGSLMFVTTAIAEVASKSGYDQAKAALKSTAEELSSKISSYTTDMSFVIKDNGKVIMSENTVNRCDVSKVLSESITTKISGASNKNEYYYYRDKNCIINYNKEQDLYYISEFPKTEDLAEEFKNPFKEKQAGDIEKIADALIGNLKDYVVVSENNDGSKELYGSISEAQIPALVNAVVSYEVKSKYAIDRTPENVTKFPRITQDIFVKEVKGNMVVDKNGLIQSILGTGIINGKDEKGNEHNLTFEVLGKVLNVNSTVVSKPDLAGKKVEINRQGYDDSKLSNPEMWVGKYKNDIIIKKDDKFEKIGERILDITNIDDKNIAGRYHVEYRKGYEEYATKGRDINFDVKYDLHRSTSFRYTSSSGDTGEADIFIEQWSGKINFSFINDRQNGKMLNDGSFIRVFD